MTSSSEAMNRQNSKKPISSILTGLCMLCLVTAWSQMEISKVDFLVGTWKVEGQEQYEVWESKNNEELTGHSFRLKNKQKIITETLSIKIIGDHIIYEATVPNQNSGRTIPFRLNMDVSDCLSFENGEHDFPKKIQYKRLSDDELEITVLGDEDEGFSYTQRKE